MKFIFKLLGVTLVIGLVLCGCGLSPTEPTNGSVNITHPTETGNVVSPTLPMEPEPVISIQYLPENVENPDNLPVLKWVVLTETFYGGGNRTWSETPVHELNKMLSDRDMPFRIQFILFTMDKWIERTEWLSRPETQEALAEADLIYGVMSSDELQNYLHPITEYAAGTMEPSLQNAVCHPLDWNLGKVGTEVYGIRTLPALVYSRGWSVKASVLESTALTEEDFSLDFQEMDEVFAKIYEKNGKKSFLYIKDTNYSSVAGNTEKEPNSYFPGGSFDLVPQTYQMIGSCFAIDHSAGSPLIVNLTQTDTLGSIREALLRYRAAGYVTSDYDNACVYYGQLMGEQPYTDITGKLCIPVTQSVLSYTAASGYFSGVAAVSQNKAAALQLLHLIAEDEAFRMQLFYGKENSEYRIENGYYTLIRQTDGSDYSLDFLSPLSYFCGLTSEDSFRSPGTINDYFVEFEGMTKLQSYQTNLDSCSIHYYPISFDYSDFTETVNKLEATMIKYFPYFNKTDTTAEEKYALLMREMKDAGGEKLLAELQLQLDAWIAENPGWVN